MLKTAAFAGLLLTASASQALDVYLQAQTYDKSVTLSDGVSTDSVPMWVFASCPDDTFTGCVPSAPGPQINLTTSDTLSIHLSNALTTPVSILIPGQAGGGDAEAPVLDSVGKPRVQSFTHEVAAGGTYTYNWTSLRAGTYLYQSGTQPSLQVPMGLYGALVVGEAGFTCSTTQTPAYGNEASCYDNDAVLLFSEIDPEQNRRVDVASAAATATPDCVSLARYKVDPSLTGYPCTIDYNPVYFLTNGETAPDLSALGLPAGSGNSDVLLRLLNAGLRTHIPSLVGKDMTLVAEDGNPYPGLALQQSHALLPAGKTLDALVTMAADSGCDPVSTTCTYDGLGLFDRAQASNSENLSQGDALATLFPGAVIPLPDVVSLAMDDIYDVTEDTAFIAPGMGVLTNDTGLSSPTLVSKPANGVVTCGTSDGICSDGTFTYTPNDNFSGMDSFTYSAIDNTDPLNPVSYGAMVTLNVSFVNDAPVAKVDGPYANTVGTNIAVDKVNGVLANDTDPDGDVLMAETTPGAPLPEGAGTCPADPAGLTLNADGSLTYDTAGGPTEFCYRAVDSGMAASDPILVQLNVNTPSGIALNVLDAVDGLAVTEYRWLVQEDRTFHHDPDAPAPLLDQQSLNFHRSSMPVVAQGCLGCANETPFGNVALDPAKYYYVSILPNDAGLGVVTDGAMNGHTIGGAQILPGQSNVTVYLNRQKIPTAQISVLVFNDNSPTNGAPDADEPGLGGFQITLEDAGGRYGISGGVMSQDAFGNPLVNSLLGTAGCPGTALPGVILTCPDGTALIKNLVPGKYGVFVTPPGEQVNDWVQTSTIEGTKIIDAWVKANEPPFFVEFGTTAPHAFIGFVNPGALGTPTGGNSISGNITLLHDPRPPGAPASVDSGSYNGLSHTRPWIGLNTIGGDGPNILTVQANEDGSFSMSGIPDGSYQLVIWDTYLDQVIHFQAVTLPADAGPIGNIAVNAWFTRTEHNVFVDANENGVRDPDEAPLPEQAINLRWRDGTVNQSFPTDMSGFVPLDEQFPFFSWQVLEVDYTRLKPTGLTVTVDGGGPVLGSGPYEGLLSLQDGSPRTELGPVLTEAYQGFPGQTSIFDWGKIPYQPGENGGIAGIVYYGSTRGEEDPRLTVGDPWEPGIASVKVRLYREVAREPSQVDTNVDPQNDFPGPGDTDVNGNGIFEGETALVLVGETTTDSWDASEPAGCPGENPTDPFTTDTLGIDNLTRCYDGWRNWNQARPGVFDGGYAFGPLVGEPLEPGAYVVEVVLPPGYELIKEQDMNVGFGDTYGQNGYAPTSVVLPNGMLVIVVPDQAMIDAAKGLEPGLVQAPCVGDYQVVPDELSLFPGVSAPFAGAARPLCNRKRVVLSDQGQSAADFHLFTSTPVAAQFTGLITDDISNETNPAAPGFGEKWSPPNLPILIRDFTGRPVYKSYADAFGRYNGLLPSTYSANVPIPSGYSPAMMSACINDPGDGAVPDPHQLTSYGSACYTAQFMPGTTTYLDTPLLPTAAFAAGNNPVDCAAFEGTPLIMQVDGTGFGPLVAPGGSLQIRSAGAAHAVPNPAYDGPNGTQPLTVNRDHGFGSGGGNNRGTVELVAADGITRTELDTTSWNTNSITATVPVGMVPGEYQLVVTRGDGGNAGNSSTNAVTVTVGSEAPIRVAAGGSIQAAIDGAAAGSLILVETGVYHELVVMSKPVRLQGSGADTVIDAAGMPVEQILAWNDKVNGLLADGTGRLLPGQVDLTDEQASGILVLASGRGETDNFAGNDSRIDGFSITGASGGGIHVNGWADNLEISNNQVTDNSGSLGGGIRIGQPFLPDLVADTNGEIMFNNNVNIHDNVVTLNGAQHFESAGGGVSMNSGSDHYVVAHNFICGNYTAGDGAGIGHLGVSNAGTIAFNRVLFNQSFNPDMTQHGGGIYIAGESAAPPALSLGTGDVTVDANLVKGNMAGSGHGGGIRTQLANGAEIPVRTNPWQITMTNNMVVNNVATWAGAGISLQDTVNSRIVNNTVANNDSTATLGSLVVGTPALSADQPAGIASEPHSPGLAAVVPSVFSAPVDFANNIVWHNRAFHYDSTQTPPLQPALAPLAVGDCAAGATYRDLGVLGGVGQLDPTSSILTDTTGYDASNVMGDPAFLAEYCNGSRILPSGANPWGPMLATAAFGEGGNFLDVRFGPLTQVWPVTGPANQRVRWDYHIDVSSAGLDNGDATPAPAQDFDGDNRPQGSGVDRGADEVATGPAPPALPMLTSITPNSAPRPTGSGNPSVTVSVEIVGTNLSGADAAVTGSGITVVGGSIVATDTTVTADFVITRNPSSVVGTHNVSVTTPGGMSNNVTFTVTP